MRTITLTRIDNETLLCNVHNEGNSSTSIDVFFVSQNIIENFISGKIYTFIISRINEKGNRESRTIAMCDGYIDYDWEEEIRENKKNRLSFTLDKKAFEKAYAPQCFIN